MNASSSSTTEPSPRASKRPRSDSQDNKASVTVRSLDLWLSDGTIILRTIQPAKGSSELTFTLYKVHKSTLAIHASFFRDLFEGPHAALEFASEQYDGLPVMDMPDNAQDVRDFLKAIYFPDYIHRHGRHASGAPYWSNFPGMHFGTLCLAKKYDAPKVKKAIVDAIRKEWSIKLQYWDERQSLAAVDRASAEAAKLERRVVYPEPAHTIRIAVDYGIPEVLPAAYYDLFRVYQLNEAKDSHHHTANIRILTADELYELILGMATLRKYIHNEFARVIFWGRNQYMCSRLKYPNPDMFDDSEDDEFDPSPESPCTKPAVFWWRQQVAILSASADPLEYLKRAGKLAMTDDGLGDFTRSDVVCTPCREYFKTIIEEKRGELWKKLPALFNLRDRVGESWG